jgi:predicted Zn finger-like uncharacterized protein
VFRITAKQLAQREGQVRCGQCRAVFDANDHLVAEERVEPLGDTPAVEALAAVATETPTSEMADAITEAPDAIAEAPDASVSVETRGEETAGVAAETRTVEAPDEFPAGETPGKVPAGETPDEAAAGETHDQFAAGETHDEVAPGETHDEVAAGETHDEVAADETPVESAGAEAPVESAPAETTPEPVPAETAKTDSAAVEPPAVERPPRYEWKPRKRVREQPALLYAAAASLLVAALALQLLLEYRDRLAAHAPFMRPILASACSLLGCTIAPLHDAGALSIDASDLQADPAHRGLLQLSATIRNRAAYAIAYPYLELTLTDASDQIVARRALEPREYVGGTANPNAGIPGNGESVVRLFIDASATSQAGYRLYLFYP